MVNEINKLEKVEKYGGDYRWEIEKCWPPNQHPPTHIHLSIQVYLDYIGGSCLRLKFY